MKNKQALIIGRFEPTCYNHVDLFEQAYDAAEKICLAIGTPNYERAKEVMTTKDFVEYQIKHFIPYKRNVETIKEVIEENFPNKPYTIVEVPDIFNSQQYANHVMTQFEDVGETLDDAIIMGENDWTLECFHDRMDVKRVEERVPYHATGVRQQIAYKGEYGGLAAKLTDKEKQRIAFGQALVDNMEATGKVVNLEAVGYEVLN